MHELTVYLAGEIHSPWRDELRRKVLDKDLDAEITYVGPQEVHDRSDDVGEDVLGGQPSAVPGSARRSDQ